MEDEIPVLQWLFPGRKKNEGFWDTVASYSVETKVFGIKDSDMSQFPQEELEQAEQEAERLLAELEQKEKPAEKPAKTSLTLNCSRG